ncbi:MAG TPA: O-antigen ligase family protein [Anaerolineales bacterium]|nr:O-antigen ligase family protein [Anaerolineales bacterium]
MTRILSLTRRLLFLLTFAGTFWPIWLWRQVLDDRPISTPFNSFTLHLSTALGLMLCVAMFLETVAKKRKWRWGDPILTPVLIGIASWGTLSALWALNAGLALWTAAEWWVVGAVYLSVVNSGERPSAWRALLPLVGPLLVVELMIGASQMATGSTLTSGILLRWGKDFRVGDPGASYLLNDVGQPLLRAYGTTEHPNQLAGFAGVLALILLGVWLAGPKSQAGRWRAGGGLVLSVMLLGTTFSRGGWIAFSLAAAYVLICGLREGRGRVVAAVGLMIATASLFFFGFGPWIAQRIAPSEAAWVEIKSLQDRALVAEGAWELFRAKPALGVGLGNYMQGAVEHLSGQVKAPVHNTMAMALSELGLMGGVLVVGLYARVIWLAWRARADLAAAVGVALALGLLVANAFDLYAWGLAPGRLFLGLLCGFCASDSAGVDSKST